MCPKCIEEHGKDFALLHEHEFDDDIDMDSSGRDSILDTNIRNSLKRDKKFSAISKALERDYSSIVKKMDEIKKNGLKLTNLKDFLAKFSKKNICYSIEELENKDVDTLFIAVKASHLEEVQ